MQISQGRGFSAFFCAVQVRIICIIRAVFGGVVGRVRGGVIYWRGRVLAGGVGQQGLSGVDFQQGGGAQCGAVGQAAAGGGLLIGLAADSKARGDGSGAVVGELGGEQFKKVHSGYIPHHRARRRVIVSPAWHRFEFPTALRQRVVDGAGKGQSVFSISH